MSSLETLMYFFAKSKDFLSNDSFDWRVEVLNFKNSKFAKLLFVYTLQQEIKLIRTSDKTMTFADKTNNMCSLSKDQGNMLLNNSITSTYQNIK